MLNAYINVLTSARLNFLISPWTNAKQN